MVFGGEGGVGGDLELLPCPTIEPADAAIPKDV